MPSAARKAEIISALEPRFASALEIRGRAAPQLLSTGIAELDLAIGGIPRGALTEIFGAASTGRSSLLGAALADATSRQEACALVDAGDAFDPASAAAAGVELDRLLWIRCGGNAERAIFAADLLAQGGGFGLLALDLGDTPSPQARRIPLTSWFRLRRAVENTPTALVVLEQEPHAKSCASLGLEMSRRGAAWSGSPGCSLFFRGLSLRAERRKPGRAGAATFQALAAG